MKYTSKITILFFLLSLTLFSQNDKTVFFCNQVLDTINYQQENIARDKFYDLTDLKEKKDEFIFRSWTGNSCIEIIKNGDQLTGKIYFAVQGFNISEKEMKKFTKVYKLENHVTQNLFSLLKNIEFLNIKDTYKEKAIVHTFEIKEKNNFKLYTTDSPQFKFKIFDIIPMNFFIDKFEKEIPFKKYTEWELIKMAEILNETPFYMTKRGE
jgi:hypothetical protein